MIWYDTETCGFHGMAVTIQYQDDNNPIVVHDVWERTVGETLDLIEYMMDQTLVGYNLSFDHFHLSKLYTTFRLLPRQARPESIIHDVYLAEEQGRFGPCLKPAEAIDLMCDVRHSKFQSGMGKYQWKLNKIHKSVVRRVLEYLNNNTHLDGYLHRSDDPIWHAEIIENKRGEWIDQDFRNIIGAIKPSTGLKSICAQVFDKPVHYFQEVMPPSRHMPVELGYIPYAKGIVDMEGWPTQDPPPAVTKKYKGTWPLWINFHKLHWKRSLPRKYATQDVEWTRKLYDYFCEEYGRPLYETNDSALTCCVASCRWRGYDLNLEKLKLNRDDLKDQIVPEIVAPSKAQKYLIAAMNDFELKTYMSDKKLEGSTKRPVLETLSKWKILCDECLENENIDGCEECPSHEVAIRAKKILESRKLTSKVRTYNKLLLSSRFHPSFIVPGTKSNRMSGGGAGFNSQGIDRTDEMRSCFTLANRELGESLAGGDFEGFELTICDAIYSDPNWHKMLLQDKKVHALFGVDLYGMTYEEIMATQGAPDSAYNKAKSGLFLLLYGGDHGGLEYKLEVSNKRAMKAEQMFFIAYPEILKRREEIFKLYRPLRDDFSWIEPKDYIETIFGHRRYFTVEWNICRLLYKLNQSADNLIKDDTMCMRVEGRRQTVAGAVKSASLGCIKKIQKKASRAAINQEIQGPGADCTKSVQKAIWDLQPCGISEWIVQPMNIHDEVPCVVHDPGYVPLVEKAVYGQVEKLKEKIPLLKLSWGSGKDWESIH